MSRSHTAVVGVLLALAACKGTSASGPAPAAAAPASVPPATPAIDGSKPLPDPLPEVAAVVNGRAVAMRHVKAVAEQAMASGRVPPNQKALAYRQALDQFIVRELLVQEALARGVTPDAQRVEQAENQVRSRYPDAAAFKAALAQQGLDEAAFRGELRVQATTDALVQKIGQEMEPPAVSDAEVKAFYEGNAAEFVVRDRVRGGHILVRVPKDASPAGKAALRARIEGVLEQIQKGGDFSALAARHSEDPASKDRGGEIEVFGRGQMPQPLSGLEQAIRALKPGEVSPVIETAAGFHIAKLFERLPDETVALDAVQEQIRQHLVGQKRHEMLEAFIRGLRAKAKIETHL